MLANRQPSDNSWTLYSVQRAITDISNGNIRSGAMLVQSMLTAPMLSAVANKRVRNIFSRQITLTAKNERQQVNINKCKLILDSLTEQQLKVPYIWYIMLGHSPSWITWEPDDDQVLKPHIEFLHPAYSTWYQLERTWKYNTMDGGIIPITPGDGNWFLMGTKNNLQSLMFSGVRALGKSWVGASIAESQQSNALENQSTSILHIQPPSSVDDNVARQIVSDYFNQRGPQRVLLTTAQGNDPTQKWEVSTINTMSPGAVDQFTVKLDRVDKHYATWMLGNGLATDQGDTGSYASAYVAKSVEEDTADADSEILGTFCREQILLVWLKMYDPDVSINDVPLLSWEPIPIVTEDTQTNI